ncbi:TetR/AcrR family transcriptional regulator [Aquihabitans sp. McL0605]|uniref:TetR/AcrR family transcriptional regulator n=1 Tax=Aquihabitans sp. McL0605 TaxID=3415671 RepID=UPI003CF8649E
MTDASVDEATTEPDADWQRRVVGRSLRSAAERSVDRGFSLIAAAATVLERSNGEDITVQEVADEAGQSLRTLYQYFASKDDLLLAVFEEAMRTYARLIRRATEELTEPLDLLAGTMLAAVRMPDFSDSGIERGLARLRLKLAEAEPDRVGQAQASVATLIRGAVASASAAKVISMVDSESATFVLMSLNGAYITAEAMGNDAGVRRPDPIALTVFCLRGLGADVDEAWVSSIDRRLKFSRRPAPGTKAKSARPAGRTKATTAGTAKKQA